MILLLLLMIFVETYAMDKQKSIVYPFVPEPSHATSNGIPMPETVIVRRPSKNSKDQDAIPMPENPEKVSESCILS